MKKLNNSIKFQVSRFACLVCFLVLAAFSNGTSQCSVMAPADTSLCEGESVTLNTTTLGQVTYSWSPTNGLSSATVANPIASPTATTFYTVTVDDGLGCTDTDQVIVTVYVLPSATSVSTDAACNLDNGTITFSFGSTAGNFDLEFSTDGGISYPYVTPNWAGTYTIDNLAPDTYDLWVRWGDEDCPINLPDVNLINQSGPSITATGDQICNGETATITAISSGGTAPLTYAWSNGLGTTATVTANPTTTTTYTVTVTDNNGCTSTNEVAVGVNVTPVAGATNSGPLTCAVTEVRINATPTNLNFFEWSWTGPNGFTSTERNPLVSVPGTYTITVTNVNSGCNDTTNTIVESQAGPADYLGISITRN